MKAAAVRKLAEEHTLADLDAAAEAIAEREEELWPIEGDDLGERLTNVLLAIRVRTRIDAGEDAKDAFRAEMAAVRETLKNA